MSDTRKALTRMNQRYEKIAELRNDKNISEGDRAAAIKQMNVEVAELATGQRGFFNQAAAGTGVDFNNVIDRGNHIQHTNCAIDNKGFLDQTAIDNAAESQVVKDLSASSDAQLNSHSQAAQAAAAAAKPAGPALTNAERADKAQGRMDAAQDRQTQLVSENANLQQAANAEGLNTQIQNVDPKNFEAKLESLQESINTASEAQARGANGIAQKYYVNQVGENFNQLPDAVLEKFNSTANGMESKDMAKTFADARVENRHIGQTNNPGNENLAEHGAKTKAAQGLLGEAKDWCDKALGSFKNDKGVQKEVADKQAVNDANRQSTFAALVDKLRNGTAKNAPTNKEKGDIQREVSNAEKTARDMGRVHDQNQKQVEAERQEQAKSASQNQTQKQNGQAVNPKMETKAQTPAVKAQGLNNGQKQSQTAGQKQGQATNSQATGAQKNAAQTSGAQTRASSYAAGAKQAGAQANSTSASTAQKNAGQANGAQTRASSYAVGAKQASAQANSTSASAAQKNAAQSNGAQTRASSYAAGAKQTGAQSQVRQSSANSNARASAQSGNARVSSYSASTSQSKSSGTASRSASAASTTRSASAAATTRSASAAGTASRSASAASTTRSASAAGTASRSASAASTTRSASAAATTRSASAAATTRSASTAAATRSASTASSTRSASAASTTRSASAGAASSGRSAGQSAGSSVGRGR